MGGRKASITAPGPSRPRGRLASTAACAMRATAASRLCSRVPPTRSIRCCGSAPTDLPLHTWTKCRWLRRGGRSALDSGCSGPIGAERAKRLLERRSERRIDALHIGIDAKRGKAGDWRCQPARDDAGEGLQVRIDIEADTVEAHPVAHADADARNLGLADEHSDLSLVSLAFDIELSERGDEPVFKRVHERAHIATPAPKIEHDISDALARTMIGEAAAAPGAKHWEPQRLDQLFRRGAGSGGVEGSVLEQPYCLRSAGRQDHRHARLPRRARPLAHGTAP